MTQRLILVTNDDGVHAPGLAALVGVLRALGDVRVVAPDREVSACSQSLTLKHPLRITELAPDVHAVDGTPADCVSLGTAKLLPRRPDVVVSGINRGANLGDDVFHSGTVGGAREGCCHGIPALAFSLAVREGESLDFSHAATLAGRLVRRVLQFGLPPRTLLNINVPAGTPAGVKITVQARREHAGIVLEALDPRQRPYYWIEAGQDRWERHETADVEAVRRGLVSITPLHTDSTHHAVLPVLRAWESLDGDGGDAPADVVAFRPRS